MAETPIEVYYDPGKTLTANLYPRGSDTVAAGSVSLTEATNRDGVYTGAIAANLSGYHTVHVIENSRTRAIYDIYLTDTTSTHYCYAVGSARIDSLGVSANALILTVDNVVDAILVDTGTTIPAQITALNDLSSADIDTALGNYGSTGVAEQATLNSVLNDTATTIPAQISALNDFDPATDTVDVGKISGSTTAATKLKYLNDAALAVTVDNATFTPTTTAFETDGAITADDTLIGMAGTWFNSSGTPANTGTFFIEDSEGTTTNVNNKLKITTETMPAAPADGDIFVILGSRVR